MIGQEHMTVTEAQFGNHVRFPQPEFAYAIYVYNEDDDMKIVQIDSIWTNSSEAINRMKILEQAENIILDADTSKKYPYRYKLHGYSEKFPYPEELSIWREKLDGTIYDNRYFIACERAQFNDKTLLKPFNLNEFKSRFEKGKDE